MTGKRGRKGEIIFSLMGERREATASDNRRENGQKGGTTQVGDIARITSWLIIVLRNKEGGKRGERPDQNSLQGRDTGGPSAVHFSLRQKGELNTEGVDHSFSERGEWISAYTAAREQCFLCLFDQTTAKGRGGGKGR